MDLGVLYAQVVSLIERIAMSESRTVVAVKLRYNPKVFWFDPALSTYAAGDHVLVDTERGREIGLVVDPVIEVTDKQIKALKSPLKPVVRVLSKGDFDRIDELDAKGRAAMPVFRELIEKHNLEVKPVSVEFLFTGDKAVFYFSNDERVDFRDLVRDLAAHFHIRVDMRQIGVRDEARILGGLAHCGEELCCARLGGEFQPVSIRMAKEQDLPLNPTKISGACGRLMCCLRYEFEAYRDFKSRAPKRGALIETPIGKAKVIDFDTPREIITMRLEDGKLFSIPLGEFDCVQNENGTARPCCISRDAIERCASSSILMALTALEQELVQKEAPPGREGGRGRGRDRGREGGQESGREDGRNGGRDSGRNGGRDSGRNGGHEDESELPVRRLRRSSRRGASGKQGAEGRVEGRVEEKRGTEDRVEGKRRGTNANRRANQSGHQGDSARQERKQGESANKGSGGLGGTSANKESGNSKGASARDRRSTQGTRPRPGQHSSGLRNADHAEDRTKGRTGDSAKDQTEGRTENRTAGRPPEQASEGSTRRTGGDRRRRRRSSNNSSS
jgi:cell fate regulator YaaT (PSP1 superfamily)